MYTNHNKYIFKNGTKSLEWNFNKGVKQGTTRSMYEDKTQDKTIQSEREKH